MENMKKNIDKITDLNNQLRQELGEIKGVIINTPLNGAPHLMNISVLGLKPEVIIHSLGEEHIFISTKSACSSKNNVESHDLTACGFSSERATTTLRISMSYTSIENDI